MRRRAAPHKRRRKDITKRRRKKTEEESQGAPLKKKTRGSSTHKLHYLIVFKIRSENNGERQHHPKEADATQHHTEEE